MRVGVLLAAGSVNLDAARSSARVLEEVGSEEVIVISTTSSGSKRNAEELVKWFDEAGISVEKVEISSDKEADMKKRLEELKRVNADLVVISPGGASLSAIASRVFDKLAHVTFPFSLWNGMYYPYVPRPLQKVYFLGDVKRSFKNLAGRFPEVKGKPIRSSLANLVKKMNEVGEKCYKIKVEIGALGEVVWTETKPCEGEAEKEKLFDFGLRMKDLFQSLMRRRVIDRGADSLLWASGILPLKVTAGKEYIADSSAIYLGIINLHVARVVTVRVPRCALYELIHKYEESLKREKTDLVGLISKYLVEEIKDLVFPSPTDLCDKAFFQMDPLVLAGRSILTEDRGIRMMWGSSPLSRLAVTETPERVRSPRDLKEVDYYNYPFALYALLQLYVMLKLIAFELRELGKEDLINGKVEVDGKVVNSFPSNS